jgi:probable F420-dependent oxidoreductase
MPQDPPSPAAALALGRIGLWSAPVRFRLGEGGLEAAQEAEALGFPTLWIAGGADNQVLADVDRLLDATARLKIGTGILNIWRYEPAEVAAWWRNEAPDRQARALVGIGVSHERLIGEAYEKPLAKMRGFLDGLDAAGMPRGRVCMAALGPRMLELAGARTAGAHPYLVTPDHTAFARKTMGQGPLLAPQQAVVLDRDVGRARDIARQGLQGYLRHANYLNSFRRQGFAEDDVQTLSDRFVDALVACGDLSVIAARVQAQLDAGADHVCLQVMTGPVATGDLAPERAAWRELASLL